MGYLAEAEVMVNFLFIHFQDTMNVRLDDV